MMTSPSQQASIRRALLQRLHVVGVAPDQKNDHSAVRAVCSELALPAEAVVQELTSMRLEQGSRMMERMGSKILPLPLLTMLTASKDVLLRRAENFEVAFRRRAEQGWPELASEVGLQAQVPVIRRERPRAGAMV